MEGGDYIDKQSNGDRGEFARMAEDLDAEPVATDCRRIQFRSDSCKKFAVGLITDFWQLGEHNLSAD